MTLHGLSILLSTISSLIFTAANPHPQASVYYGNQTGPRSGNSTSPNSTTHLQIPALALGSDGNSQFQCWQLQNPFTATSSSGNQPGVGLGDVEGASIAVYPPESDSSVQTTRVPALLYVISGLVRIDLPNNASSSAWLIGGVTGSIILDDTSGSGHHFSYPSDESTVTLTLPFAGGVPPQYTVIGFNVCSSNLGRMGGNS